MANNFGYADGLMALSGIIGIGGDFFAARSAERSAGYSADIMSYNTRYIDARQKLDEARIDRDLKQVIGTQRAQTAASGIMSDVGTPLELQVESRILADIDKALLRISGGMEKLNIATTSMLQRSAGSSEAGRYYGSAAAKSINFLGGLLDRHGSTISGMFKKAKNPRPGGYNRADLQAISNK